MGCRSVEELVCGVGKWLHCNRAFHQPKKAMQNNKEQKWNPVKMVVFLKLVGMRFLLPKNFNVLNARGIQTIRFHPLSHTS